MAGMGNRLVGSKGDEKGVIYRIPTVPHADGAHLSLCGLSQRM
jgi:hypothetical protein